MHPLRQTAHLFKASDDALPAFRSLHPSKHILLFTPTSPQTHEYHFQPLAQALANRSTNPILAMDYTPPRNDNKYLPYDTRHQKALDDESCAAVIVVVREDVTKTRGCQMDFAKKVWDVACATTECPGILLLVGGSRRAVGDWGTILCCEGMGDETLDGVATLIFPRA